MTSATAVVGGSHPGGRIARAFARARAEQRKALVLYLTAGDPDAETSRRLMLAAARAGADVIELGVPWSDPSADGPAIQAAMRRALRGGGGMGASLEVCRALRAQDATTPVVVFGYANPILVRGEARFAAAVRAAGADGVLCVDLPPDEAKELTLALRVQDIDFITIISPISTPERVRFVARQATGFLYYVSLTGITGSSLDDLEGPRRQVGQIRGLVGDALPIVVGFGIATPEQARAVGRCADGVVVGSAAVRVIEREVAAGRDPVAALESFVRSLRAALATP